MTPGYYILYRATDGSFQNKCQQYFTFLEKRAYVLCVAKGTQKTEDDSLSLLPVGSSKPNFQLNFNNSVRVYGIVCIVILLTYCSSDLFFSWLWSFIGSLCLSEQGKEGREKKKEGGKKGRKEREKRREAKRSEALWLVFTK